jgi:hypothetical protein
MHVRAAKIIFRLDWHTSGKDVVKKVKRFTLNTVYKQQLLYLAYKYYHNLAPPTLQTLFRKNVHRYNFRNKMICILPKPKHGLSEEINFLSSSHPLELAGPRFKNDQHCRNSRFISGFISDCS